MSGYQPLRRVRLLLRLLRLHSLLVSHNPHTSANTSLLFTYFLFITFIVFIFLHHEILFLMEIMIVITNLHANITQKRFLLEDSFNCALL